MSTRDDNSWSEKIVIEPDLGEQRQSVFKALPSPPTTPKRVTNKYRFSALITLVFVTAGFLLTIVVILAGMENGMFSEHHLVVLNTTRLGQDIIRFEPVTATASPSGAASTTRPNSLNPPSTDSPLNPNNPNSPFKDLNKFFGSVSDNLTTAIDSGIGTLLNNVTEQAVRQAGIKDYYFLYLQQICSATWDPRNREYTISQCSTYSDAEDDLKTLMTALPSSTTIGKTQISLPLLAKFPSALASMSHILNMVRRLGFAFLVISLVGAGVSIVLALPAVMFPDSRMLVYINTSSAMLSNVFAFMATALLTVLYIGLLVLGKTFGNALSVTAKGGKTVLFFVWTAWFCTLLVNGYWFVLWAAELRTWTVVKREREHEGGWRKDGLEYIGRKRPKMIL